MSDLYDLRDLTELHNKCIDSLNLSAGYVFKYLDKSRKNEEIKKLELLLKDYCELDLQRQVSEHAFINARDSSDNKNAAQFQKVYQENIRKLVSNKPPIHKHPAFVEFKTNIARIKEVEDTLNDSDLVQTQSIQKYIDPITKKRIECPVRNKRCKHVYEKTTIIDMIRMNPRTKCPVVGCGHNTFLTPADIEEDDELRFIIETQNSNTQDEEDIDPLSINLDESSIVYS